MTVQFLASVRYFLSGLFVLPQVDATPPSLDSTVRVVQQGIDPQWTDTGGGGGSTDAGFKVLWSEDFSTWPTADNANPTVSLWNQRMGMGTNNTGPSISQKVSATSAGLVNITLLNLGGGNRCLRFRLPQDYTDKGTALWCNLPQPYPDEAILYYRIRFEDPFGSGGPFWGYGGKLPGLGGVDVTRNVTPATPSGGNYAGDRGWSGRQMWIGRNPNGKSSYPSQLGTRPNRGLFYRYGYDQLEKVEPTAYGDNDWYATPTAASGTWVSGQWHLMRVHYKLNTIGKADGIINVQVDGVKVYGVTNWQPRVVPTVLISHLWMHIFRGGNDSTWGVPTTEYVDIDDLKILVPDA